MPTDEKPPCGGEPDSSSAVSGDASPDDQSSAPDGHPDDQDDFSRLLDESFEVVSFEVGQSVEGEIVALDADGAFIDIGGKGEATIDLSELANDDGDVEEKVGDRVKAVVVSTRGGLKLSRKLARGAAAKTQLDAAFRAGMPVEGRVEAVNKGGYEVRIAGQRAFCPLSQMDTVRGTEPAEYVGKVHAFRIVEWKAGGKDLVVSRRALLEAEAREKAAEVMRTVVPGTVLSGRVVSVRDFGAFIELGAGIQGLLHVSEMGWSRVSSPAEIVQPGDELAVHVLKVDAESKKISLSLKQLQADPWSKVSATYVIGQVTQGRITRVAEFGAFVELEPGIEALAHVSTFPSIKGGWKKLVEVGAFGRFRIENIDLDRRRIGVALHDVTTEDEAAVEGHVTRERSGGGTAAGAGERIASGAAITPLAGKVFGSFADQLRAAVEKPKDGDE